MLILLSIWRKHPGKILCPVKPAILWLNRQLCLFFLQRKEQLPFWYIGDSASLFFHFRSWTFRKYGSLILEYIRGWTTRDKMWIYFNHAGNAIYYPGKWFEQEVCEHLWLSDRLVFVLGRKEKKQIRWKRFI